MNKKASKGQHLGERPLLCEPSLFGEAQTFCFDHKVAFSFTKECVSGLTCPSLRNRRVGKTFDFNWKKSKESF